MIRILALVFCVNACWAFFGGSLISAQQEADRVENLGSPIRSIRVATVAFGPGPEGEPYGYVIPLADPSVLTVVDLRSGERVEALPLEGSSGCWGAVTAPDGSLYISSHPNGYLYRYRPGSGEVENLGEAIRGEAYLYQLTVDDQGRIYGGTYPGGKVFRFDPASGEFHDYGRLVEGDDWGRSTLFADGYLYAGTGPSAQLVRLDVESGERSLIPLPMDPPIEEGSVYHLNHVDGRLLVRVERVPDGLVYDLESGEWIGKLKDISGREPSPPDANGRIYYTDTSKRIHWYDPATGETGETGARAPFVTLQWEQVELDEAGFPGRTLVTGSMRGAFFLFNPQTGNTRVIKADVARSPVHIQAVAAGPDGRIYAGGYLSPEGMAAFDPESGTFEEIPGITQVEGMTSHDGKLFIGTYPNANVHVYDPSAPLRPGNNPRHLFQVGHSQLRTFALASAGQRVAVGSVPTDGSYGGALILYDPGSGEHEVFRHVVENHSVSALVSRGGIVWGGTSANAGRGTPSGEGDAKLFAWDLARGEKVWEGIAIPGEHAVSALEFDERGRLWGLINGWIFQFDPEAREVVKSRQFLPTVSRDGWGQARGMSLYSGDSRFYGNMNGRLFRFDPESWEIEFLAENARLFAQDRAGNVYFARETDLFQWKFDDGKNGR